MNTTSNVNAGKNEAREGKVAKTIEKQTSKLPSDLFLWAAGASIVGSLALQVAGMGGSKGGLFMKKGSSRSGQLGNFVGQWAPTFLLLGIYNKIVKVAGSDQSDRGAASKYDY